MLPFPLQIPPDLLFCFLHLFMEHAGRDPESTMAQDNDLFHAIGGGHADAAALADLMGDTLNEHIGGLGFPGVDHMDIVVLLYAAGAARHTVGIDRGATRRRSRLWRSVRRSSRF